ncbi:MAG: hypothetical protein INQ03_15620 [Candidatus Heimdallarchaeota archaeon]|nr:hypothetical protein [Candidatus Heimdallarchaeota archaeon]
MSFRQSLLLSCQRALLGAITINIRGITVGYDPINPSIVRLLTYFDQEPTMYELELMRIACTEVIADFEQGEIVDEHKVVQEPETIEVLTDWIYLRYETIKEN